MEKKHFNSYDDWKLSEPSSYSNSFCIYCDEQEIHEIAEKEINKIFLSVEALKTKIQKSIESFHTELSSIKLKTDTDHKKILGDILDYTQNIDEAVEYIKEKKLEEYLAELKKEYTLCKDCFIND